MSNRLYRQGASLAEVFIVVAVVAILALVLTSLCGGGGGSTSSGYQPGTKPAVAVESFLLDAKDFDLGTVTSLLKEGDKVKNVTELEAEINRPDSAINNVDLDKDGKVDYVGINETDEGDGAFTIDFVANPVSDTWKDGPVTIATMRFDTASGEVDAAYPSYVSGYGSHYYSYGGWGVAHPFYGYLYAPHVAYVYHMPVGYVSYGVLPPSSLSTARSTYRTTSSVTTVSPTKQPATYKPSASAAKTSSAVAAKSKSASGASTYKPTSTSAQKTTGSSSWGSSGKSSGSSASKPASKPSSSSRPASRPSSSSSRKR